MTKKEVRKASYRLIVKEGKSHQEAYDELIVASPGDPEWLANEIAKVPSSGRMKQTATLRYILIALLVIVLLLRALGVFSLLGGDLNPMLLLTFVLLGIAVPAYAIWGILSARIEVYQLTGILLILGILRSFRGGEAIDAWTIGVLVPFVLAIVLLFYLPSKLKTSFSRKVRKENVNGTTKTFMDITFEDSRARPEGVLDTDL